MPLPRQRSNISDKKFPAKAAIYARNEFGMRSISHVVAGELAKRVRGEPWATQFFNKLNSRKYKFTDFVQNIWKSMKKCHEDYMKLYDSFIKKRGL